MLLVIGLFALAAAQGTLIIAQGTDPASLDAAKATDSPSATVYSHIYETLYELTADGEVVPQLATGVTVSSDNMTYVFDIRQGVTFHDGTPLTANEVKASIEQFLAPETAAPFRFLLDRIAEVNVLDTYKVEVKLASVFAPLITHLTHSSTAIVKTGVDLDATPIGTGPFEFVSWDRGQRVDLKRYEGYWGDKPGIDGLRFLAVPESTTRMALVETGEAHVAVRVPPQDIARLNANPNVTVEQVSSVRTIYIYFNHTMEPFTDVRVRQAINYAVDKEELVEFVLGGAARVSDAPISPGVFGYTPVGSYEFDPEKARELLAEAGFPDGFSTTLYSPNGRYLQDIQVSEAIQSQLARVGIDAQIETLEWNAYLAKTNMPAEENEVPFAMLGWGTVTGDADYGHFALFHSTQHVPNGSNRAFYANPTVDALLDQARTNTDPALRAVLYEEVMKLLWDDAAWLFLYSETQLVAVRDGVEGLVIHPTERYLAFDVSLR
ncbi:MAG: glutathione ABC transporter substrate-binding protein [Trueperaceae bacterium]|nr:glutathione ABC transporter substrate-binding protein [Trueperaceae bacterium]